MSDFYFEVDGIKLHSYGEDIPPGWAWRVRSEEPHKGLVEVKELDDDQR